MQDRLSGPRIAVLGWGSLIWDLEILAPHALRRRQDRAPDWRMGAGPTLPLEFSRISRKRGGALTLVVDDICGADCATHALPLRTSLTDSADALAHGRAVLAARERASLRHIGAMLRGQSGASQPGAAMVGSWLANSDWEGAVWTALPPIFAEQRGEPFSVAAAMAYLEQSPPDTLREAVQYIELAPDAARTPLRDALAQSAFWREAVATYLNVAPGSHC